MSKHEDRINIEIIRKNTTTCEECGNDMYVDDVDYRFDGCYDVYYACTCCNTSCITQVRFGQKFKENWHTENDGKVREWEHKYKIKRI